MQDKIRFLKGLHRVTYLPFEKGLCGNVSADNYIFVYVFLILQNYTAALHVAVPVQ